jgi:calcineurin-like phosphoesterase
VITSGNHIWDKEETTDYIDKENRLLRPSNLQKDHPEKVMKYIFKRIKNIKLVL